MYILKCKLKFKLIFKQIVYCLNLLTLWTCNDPQTTLRKQIICGIVAIVELCFYVIVLYFKSLNNDDNNNANTNVLLTYVCMHKCKQSTFPTYFIVADKEVLHTLECPHLDNKKKKHIAVFVVIVFVI